MLRRLVAVALIVTGCALTPAAEEVTTPSMGGTWTIVRVGPATAIPMHEPRVQFTIGGEVVGVSGCSDFEGPVEVTGNSIAVGGLVSTYIDPACHGPVREFHEAFLAVLRTSQTVEQLGRGRLRISGPVGDMVLLAEGHFDLTPDEVAFLNELQAQPWALVRATGLPAEPPPLAFEFGDDNAAHMGPDFTALGPCGFSGQYRSRGDDRIQLHTISHDEGDDCPPAGQILRTRLTDALVLVNRFEREADPNRLTLRGDEVEIVLEAEVRP